MNQNPFARRALSRRGFVAGGLSATVLLLAGCRSSGGSGDESLKEASLANSTKIDGDLNLVTYADYIAPQVLSGFEKEYGVKVNYTYFSSGDEAVAKLSSGQPIDVMTMGSESIYALARSGLLKRVDHDALQNWDQVIPEFEIPPYNGDDEEANKATAPFVGAPYATGAVGLAWRTDKVSDMTGTFEDLWTHPEAKGHIFVWDSMQLTMSLFLRRLGIDPATAGDAEMSEVIDAAAELEPMLGGFSGVDTTRIENGQAWLSPAYAGDMFLAINAMPAATGKLWELQMNEESALFNADNFVIPTASEHTGTAMAFLDWYLAPENMRTNVNYVGYPIPTRAGMATYRTLTSEYPWLQFDDAVFSDTSQWLTPIPDDKRRMWQQTWNTIKAA